MPLYRGNNILDPKGIQRAYYGNTLVFDREGVEEPTVPEPIPAYSDPNWDDVLFILGHDYDYSEIVPTRFGSGNRAHYALNSISSTMSPRSDMGHPHLPFIFEMTIGTSRTGSFIDNEQSLGFGAGGEFTIEGWIYTTPHNTTEATYLVNARDTRTAGCEYVFGLTGSWATSIAPDTFGPTARQPIFVASLDGLMDAENPSNLIILRGTQLPSDTWVYLSVCRDANDDVRLFADGQMVAKQHLPTFFVKTDTIEHRKYYVQSNINGGGYYGSLRISKRALYISDSGHEIPTKIYPYGKDKTGDVYWKNVSCLIRGNVAPALMNGSPPSLSRYGGVHFGSPNSSWENRPEAKYGYGSIFFNDASRFTACLYHNDSGFNVNLYDMKGVTPFTVEAWINRDGLADTSRRGICGFYRTIGDLRQWVFNINNSKLELICSTDGTGQIFTSTVDLPLDGWVHVALTRDSNGTFRLYQDGQIVMTITDLEGQELYDALTAGLQYFDILGYNGANNLRYRCSELRVTKGIARYTGNTFTPPQELMPAYEYVAPIYDETEQDELIFDKDYDEGSIVAFNGFTLYLPYEPAYHELLDQAFVLDLGYLGQDIQVLPETGPNENLIDIIGPTIFSQDEKRWIYWRGYVLDPATEEMRAQWEIV